MWDGFRGYLFQQPLVNELGPVGRQVMRGLYQRRFATALLFAAGLHVSLMAGAAIMRQIHGIVAQSMTGYARRSSILNSGFRTGLTSSYRALRRRRNRRRET